MFNICRFYYHITKVHEVAYNSAQGVQVCAQFEAQFRQQLSPCGEQECTNERKFSEECIRRKEAKEHIIEDFKEYERRNTLEGEYNIHVLCTLSPFFKLAVKPIFVESSNFSLGVCTRLFYRFKWPIFVLKIIWSTQHEFKSNCIG